MNAKMSDTKAGYQRIISVYLQRRNDLRDKFTVNGKKYWYGANADPIYAKKAKVFTDKIYKCKRAIKRIDLEYKQLLPINELLFSFLNISVLKLETRGRDNYMKVLATNIFCSYCLENGHRSSIIGEFLGIKPYKVTQKRLIFKRSFKTNKTNEDYWHKWKQFLKIQNEK
jgi:hypothetical protein